MVMWAELGVFVSVCAGALSTLLMTCFQSRCTRINLCCGALECVRNVPDVTEPTDDANDDDGNDGNDDDTGAAIPSLPSAPPLGIPRV